MNQFPNEHKAIQQLKELSDLDQTYNWTKQLLRMPKTANSNKPRKQLNKLPPLQKIPIKLPLQEISFNMNNIENTPILPKLIRVPILKPHTAKLLKRNQREN